MKKPSHVHKRLPAISLLKRISVLPIILCSTNGTAWIYGHFLDNTEIMPNCTS